jgi:hypothetical protein
MKIISTSTPVSPSLYEERGKIFSKRGETSLGLSVGWWGIYLRA